MILAVQIKEIVEGLLDFIQEDCSNKPEKETFLYHVLNGQMDGQFNFHKQAISLLTRKNSNPRKVQVRLEFPKDKTHLPCIVIREPSRQPQSPQPFGGIGCTVGIGNEYPRERFIATSQSKVDIMCISENYLESILISEIIYMLLQGARNSFEKTFHSFQFSVSEVIAENSLFPMPILMKTISLDLTRMEDIPSILSERGVDKFIIHKAIVVEE